MKKIIKYILIALLIPQLTFAAFTVGWNATSTTQGWVLPNLVNGVLQIPVANQFLGSFFTATSSSATSNFLGNLFIGGSTTLQRFTFTNGTGTSATTTNLFSTTASSSNLYSADANFGITTTGRLLTSRGGSNLNPSIYFVDSNNSGFYSPADNYVHFGNANGDIFKIPTNFGNFSMGGTVDIIANGANVGDLNVAGTITGTTAIVSGGNITANSGTISGSAVTATGALSGNSLSVTTSGSFASVSATGDVSGNTITSSGNSGNSGECVQFGAGGVLTSAGAACGVGGGGSFPFTVRSYGVSTSTVVGFLSGMFSVGSTTVDGNLRITGNATATNATTSVLAITSTASTSVLYVGSAGGGTAGCATFSATGLLSNTGTACGSGVGGGGGGVGFASSTDAYFNNQSIYMYGKGYTGFGTTTPRWLVQIASSTAPQMALSDGSLTSNHWIFRNAGGLLYLATASPSTLATSTVPALTINSSGYLGLGSSTPSQVLSVTGNSYVSGNSTTTNLGILGVLNCTTVLQTTASGGVFCGSAPAAGAGGSDTQIQYNNGGTLGGATAFVWNGTRGAAGLGTTTPNTLLTLSSSTAPQLVFTDGSLTATQYFIRNVADKLWFGSSTPATGATTTQAGLVLDLKAGTPSFQVGDSPVAITYLNSGTSTHLTQEMGTQYTDIDPGVVTGQSIQLSGSCVNGTPQGLVYGETGNATTSVFIGGKCSNINNIGVITTGLQVGFGTTTPAGPLEVVSASSSQLILSPTTPLSGFKWHFRSAGNNLYISTSTNTIWGYATSSMPAVTINANGYMGLATTSPWRTLSVNGSVAFAGLTSSGTGNAVCISTGKEILDAGGGTCTPSSIQFKENLKPLPSNYGLGTINKLNLVFYDYKDKQPHETNKSLGVIAEEVEKLGLKDFVDYDYQGNVWGVHYEKFIMLNTKAIQELAKDNNWQWIVILLMLMWIARLEIKLRK